MKDSGVKHLKKVCLSYININTVTNKLEALSDFVAISETKLHNSLPTVKFNILGFRTLNRKKYNCEKWWLLVYVNGDILSRMIYVSIYDCPRNIPV